MWNKDLLLNNCYIDVQINYRLNSCQNNVNCNWLIYRCDLWISPNNIIIGNINYYGFYLKYRLSLSNKNITVFDKDSNKTLNFFHNADKYKRLIYHVKSSQRVTRRAYDMCANIFRKVVSNPINIGPMVCTLCMSYYIRDDEYSSAPFPIR